VPILGSERLDQLTADDLDRMLRKLARDGGRVVNGKAQGAGRNTIELTRKVLSMALDWAVERRRVGRNEARYAIVPDAPERKSRSLTLDQAKALLAAIEGDRFEAAWRLMITCGLRPGEVFGLRWSDLDLDGDPPTLVVAQALRRVNGNTFELGRPKTASSVRKLSLAATPTLVGALKRRQEIQAAELRHLVQIFP
jgi:integrase